MAFKPKLTSDANKYINVYSKNSAYHLLYTAKSVFFIKLIDVENNIVSVICTSKGMCAKQFSCKQFY